MHWQQAAWKPRGRNLSLAPLRRICSRGIEFQVAQVRVAMQRPRPPPKRRSSIPSRVHSACNCADLAPKCRHGRMLSELLWGRCRERQRLQGAHAPKLQLHVFGHAFHVTGDMAHSGFWAAPPLRRVEYSSVARFKYDDTLEVAQAAL